MPGTSYSNFLLSEEVPVFKAAHELSQKQVELVTIHKFHRNK